MIAPTRMAAAALVELSATATVGAIEPPNTAKQAASEPARAKVVNLDIKITFPIWTHSVTPQRELGHGLKRDMREY